MLSSFSPCGFFFFFLAPGAFSRVTACPHRVAQSRVEVTQILVMENLSVVDRGVKDETKMLSNVRRKNSSRLRPEKIQKCYMSRCKTVV